MAAPCPTPGSSLRSGGDGEVHRQGLCPGGLGRQLQQPRAGGCEDAASGCQQECQVRGRGVRTPWHCPPCIAPPGEPGRSESILCLQRPGAWCTCEEDTSELSGDAGLPGFRTLVLAGPNQLPSYPPSPLHSWVRISPELPLMAPSPRERGPRVPHKAWVGGWHAQPVRAHLCAPLGLSIRSVWFLFRKGMIF